MEQEGPGRTQAAAMRVSHGGADGERSHCGGRAKVEQMAQSTKTEAGIWKAAVKPKRWRDEV